MRVQQSSKKRNSMRDLMYKANGGQQRSSLCCARVKRTQQVIASAWDHQ
jgi:hypothetical protein